ncbi:hypothetical protein FHR84_000962 [Actinopolyspora biskrensis]|uniref:Uncharacterized protein n=1 Tax=Actinopolyspora biskrensis TaxID=1470178 RepID=A0A852YUK1_9ACTN|nr:hypothetical protein [Actinopolyspora biskrensis]
MSGSWSATALSGAGCSSFGRTDGAHLLGTLREKGFGGVVRVENEGAVRRPPTGR